MWRRCHYGLQNLTAPTPQNLVDLPVPASAARAGRAGRTPPLSITMTRAAAQLSATFHQVAIRCRAQPDDLYGYARSLAVGKRTDLPKRVRTPAIGQWTAMAMIIPDMLSTARMPV